MWSHRGELGRGGNVAWDFSAVETCPAFFFFFFLLNLVLTICGHVWHTIEGFWSSRGISVHWSKCVIIFRFNAGTSSINSCPVLHTGTSVSSQPGCMKSSTMVSHFLLITAVWRRCCKCMTRRCSGRWEPSCIEHDFYHWGIKYKKNKLWSNKDTY